MEMEPSNASPSPVSQQSAHSSLLSRRLMRMIQIVAPVLVILALAVVLFTRGAASITGSNLGGVGTQKLQGTVLNPIRPAPTFRLLDQHSDTISLDQLRGHPVVLTFLDSVCPHNECPLMAQYLDTTTHLLGSQQTANVIWLAISVDPWHDTSTTAQAFLTSHHVQTPIHFLLGSPAQLAPLWKAYYMQAVLQPDGVVIHTTGVYVIDKQGRERVWLDPGFDPMQLSTDLHILLAS